ncbi:MAG: InlB B-repeat-containing protein [Bacilli bacterium]|nr:InlB B-repeat-containing protein [Bacilli bacterium]
MKFFRTKTFLTLLPFIATIFGCNNSFDEGPFTITWQNDDGTVLEVDYDVPRGTTPTYEGDTPRKDPTQQYTYTFCGWSPSVGVAEKDETYVAKYTSTLNKCDVIFNSDGGSYTPETQHIDYGYYATPPAPPTKYSFDFTGWYEEGATKPFDFSKTKIIDTVRLKAKWKTAVYCVTFHSNCGKDSKADVEHGNKVTPPTITNTGYDLDGWYTDPTFSEGSEFDFSTGITQKTDLYAKWTLKDCTVKFNAGENAVITGTSSESYTTPVFKYGKTWKELNDKTGTKTGYTFKHWSLENSETGEAISESYKPEGNINVYAVYTINTYTVSFVSRGGNQIKEKTVKHGDYIDEPIPTYGNHDFQGWYISDTYQGSAFNFDTTPITSDLTLYAKWDEYDITFDGNGGYFDDTKTTTSKTISVACGETPIIANPKRDSTAELDYTFDGWDKELEVVYEPNTYQAQWESSDREYTFEFNGTSCSADGYSSTYHYNDDIAFTITPVAGDYVLSKTISVSIDGAETTTDKYSYDYITGAFSMKCIGNISITVTASQDTNCTTLSYTRSKDDYNTVQFAYEGTLDHVNWGDGTYDTNSSHVFSENKDYTIYIFGSLTSIDFHKGSSTLAKGNQYITSIKLSSTINHFKVTKGDPFSSFAFMGRLTSITLSNSIEDNDAQGVFRTTGLTSIVLPINEKFTKINPVYFANCSKLKEVTVSNYITVFDYSAFEGCKTLDTISFPSNLTTIGYRAFYQCTALPTPTLPNSLTTIGHNAFEDCQSFTGSLTIPASVVNVGSQAFIRCDNLLSINVPFREGEKPAEWADDWNDGYSGTINYLE